ncbi:hypothetical protein Taro_003737, partial [Colocasia esculenta]|nr:hypothetical protein [Colocasia esculenta]
VYLSVSQPRTKGPAAAPRKKVKQLWRPTKHHHLQTTRSQAHASHLQRPWPGLARVRHWKRTSWGPVRLLVSVRPTKSALQVTKNKLKCHCPTVVFPSAGRTTQTQSEGVQEDDTDLDGTQVPGQAPSTHVPSSHKTWGSQLKR